MESKLGRLWLSVTKPIREFLGKEAVSWDVQNAVQQDDTVKDVLSHQVSQRRAKDWLREAYQQSTPMYRTDETIIADAENSYP